MANSNHIGNEDARMDGSADPPQDDSVFLYEIVGTIREEVKCHTLNEISAVTEALQRHDLRHPRAA
jgi:hypothetical protein